MVRVIYVSAPLGINDGGVASQTNACEGPKQSSWNRLEHFCRSGRIHGGSHLDMHHREAAAVENGSLRVVCAGGGANEVMKGLDHGSKDETTYGFKD